MMAKNKMRKYKVKFKSFCNPQNLFRVIEKINSQIMDDDIFAYIQMPYPLELFVKTRS
jgi:hypothetical protein